MVASLSFDNMQKEAHRRESSQDKKTTALTPRPSQSDYAKIAKQVREWSFRFDGAEKPFQFLEQVEWSANTYGLDLDMIPRTMPELLKGRALKWFIANNKQWRTWAGFSAKRFLHQASGPGPATEARLQRVVQGLHDRHADDGEAT